VWNTSLAFFQLALLAGYFYAHTLQRLRDQKLQVLIHLAVLLTGLASLPLQVSGLLGAPSSNWPTLWLLGVLILSLGFPFAALSATAPLVQAWYVRWRHHSSAGDPYGLYAASNLGSLVALAVYPIIVEPQVGLHIQTTAWSMAYFGFIALIGTLGLRVSNVSLESLRAIRPTARSTFRERIVWIALAAAPSSLMLGVTNFIATDLGSAPFLWAAPLALYLLTFIIAFSGKSTIRPALVLALHAALLTICALLFWFPAFLPELALHLEVFFATALVCHQALYARRPTADRLTDFYLWVAVGGVVGGAFNAFVAPQIFNGVIEYPVVLALSCLARPWGDGPLTRGQWVLALATLALAASAVIWSHYGTHAGSAQLASFGLLAVSAICALLLTSRAILFSAAIFIVLLAGHSIFAPTSVLARWRDFFGVLTVSHQEILGLGDVKFLRHGDTNHGAESSLPTEKCYPLTYYAPRTPIGQVLLSVQAKKSAINAGFVGLGTGAVAAYMRSSDAATFFEIDPLVIQVATNPAYFNYTTTCGQGRISYVLGDARLKLNQEANGKYDLLLIDAFASDSVPTHLLTVEAIRMYLSKLTPDGVLILHLSNKYLDLMRPAMAGASTAGAMGLQQTFKSSRGPSGEVRASSTQVVILARTKDALRPFLLDEHWSVANAGGVKAWTDDYTNVFGALMRHSFQK